MQKHDSELISSGLRDSRCDSLIDVSFFMVVGCWHYSFVAVMVRRQLDEKFCPDNREVLGSF